MTQSVVETQHNPVSIAGVTPTAGGALPVSCPQAVGIGVVGSNYDADKTATTTSKREAIPSGAPAIWVSNESVTTLESARFVFGDSTIVATATSGFRVSPGITTAAGDNGRKDISVPVPEAATHWAYIAESGTPTLNVVWGG